MSIAEAIRKARRARGWSQAELGQRTGISQVAIKKIEAGTTRKSKYLPDIARALDMQLSDIDPSFRNVENRTFTTADNSIVGERNLPVFASAEAGAGTMVLSSDPVDFVRRPAPLANVKDGYALIVVGESMVPAFEPGDMLLVHPHLPPVPGADVVLYSDNGSGEVRVTVKRLRRATADSWLLTQFNPPKGKKADFALSREEWQKCHRIVGKYSRR